jgi:aspartate carbamoyltransferase catalytic subunit
MMRIPRHLISAAQFTDRNLLRSLFISAAEMEARDASRTLSLTLSGRILATIFYEPSTRTRLSFEAAMQKLGGSVLTAENARENSSAAKGESITDAIRVIGGYADVIVMRHFEEGAAAAAAAISPVPLINAGDGKGEHPTQALVDMYTITKEIGDVEGKRIALVGDLLYGRTVHSLLHLLSHYRNVTVELVSPKSLRLPAKYLDPLRAHGVQVIETESFRESTFQSDVLYVTRIQKERFESESAYEAIKDTYFVDASVAAKLKPDAVILHALPRVNEIAPEVDADPRAAYFRQARNGLFLRMALLQGLLS